MTYQLPLSAEPKTVLRHYYGLAGVDFANIPSRVATNRSPDAVNVYKNYLSTNGQAIETRPGTVNLGNLGETVYGIHFLGDVCLIHHGTTLSKWDTFPSAISSSEDLTQLYTGMNAGRSVSFLFGGKLYLLDGAHYLVCNASSVAEVAVNATVPTTRIAADPDGSHGEEYQEINLLNNFRENTFVADGTSTQYCLDAQSLDDASIYTMQAWIDDSPMTEGSGFSVNRTDGTVTFSTAPSAPMTTGQANVRIRFSKTVSGNKERITACTIAETFDNRVFFAGNEDHPAAMFHCELDDPSYCKETAYYIDGEDETKIRALVRGADVMIAIKEDAGTGSKLFLHTPSLDSTFGKIYPTATTEISLGAVAGGINFFDDVVFLSRLGLEGLRVSSSSFSLEHRSTMVDRKLINESDFANAFTEVWGNYLAILVGSHLYLADRRQTFRGTQSTEYEWYYWTDIGAYEAEGTVFYPATLLKAHGGSLYFAASDGSILRLEGTHDDGHLIESHWTTPMDDFDAPIYLKSIDRKGCMAQVKRIQNSILKIDVMTDSESWRNVHTSTTAGFSFDPDVFNFVHFSFGSGIRGQTVYRFKHRRVKEISLKFYSDEIGKPFGLYEATLEAAIMNYIRN